MPTHSLWNLIIALIQGVMSCAKYVLAYIKLISRARRSKMTGIESREIRFIFSNGGRRKTHQNPTTTQKNHKTHQGMSFLKGIETLKWIIRVSGHTNAGGIWCFLLCYTSNIDNSCCSQSSSLFDMALKNLAISSNDLDYLNFHSSSESFSV